MSQNKIINMMDPNPNMASNYGTITYSLVADGSMHPPTPFATTTVMVQPSLDPMVLKKQTITSFKQGKIKEALVFAEQYLLSKPHDSMLLNLAAVCCLKLDQYPQAEAYFRQLIQIKPDFADAHNNLANLLSNLRRYEEAIFHFQQAMAIQPDVALFQNNLAVLLQDMQRYDEAENMYRQIIQDKPDYVEVYYHLGILLQDTQRYDEAIAIYQHSLRIQPNYAKSAYNLSLLYLAAGQFEQGWPLYESRYHPQREANIMPIDLPFFQWHGENLAGKSLLIVPEQGLGDQIQFCRYTSMLKQQGLKYLAIACSPPLLPLLATLDGVDQTLIWPLCQPITHFDYWSYPLSIPLYVGTTLSTIPNRFPYLHPLPERIDYWQAHLPPGPMRIGLVWKGNAAYRNDQHRSLPNLSFLAPLWSIPNTIFVSLQRGDATQEATLLADLQPMLYFGDQITDFADTAAIIAQLDLVISVDTAVAHLTGALGVPCWLLLSASKTDWRWLRHRQDSPWYPQSMRLFQQKQGGDWSDVIGQITVALQQACQYAPFTPISLS